MKEGNLCERCEGKVQPEKAIHKQTKYCDRCAQIMKRANTLDSWSPEKRRDYMRRYMREYRAHGRLYCLVLFLPLLAIGDLSPEALQQNYDGIATAILYAEILVVKLTGLAFVVIICVRHLRHTLANNEKQEESYSVPIVDSAQSATLNAQSPPLGDHPRHFPDKRGERLQVPPVPAPAMDRELRALPRGGHHEPPHAAPERQRPFHEGDDLDAPREPQRRA